MESHFCAFSFVDRITGVEPGVRIRGRYTVPLALEAFPISLVAEAVGQLAAWSAMAAVGFAHRPVAGIAGRIELLSAVRPGQVLELAADLQSVDTETVGYSGIAHVDGTPVIRLCDCVGPMMPAGEFDDPAHLRDRFALLSSHGAEPGAFRGVPALDLEPGGGVRGQSVNAVLHVPAEAGFFADHFPRRAVFPGTLLMHAQLETAAWLAAEVPAGGASRWVPRIVSEVKLRTFVPPGATLALEARRSERSDKALTLAVESRTGRQRIGSAAIQFEPALTP